MQGSWLAAERPKLCPDPELTSRRGSLLYITGPRVPCGRFSAITVKRLQALQGSSYSTADLGERGREAWIIRTGYRQVIEGCCSYWLTATPKNLALSTSAVKTLCMNEHISHLMKRFETLYFKLQNPFLKNACAAAPTSTLGAPLFRFPPENPKIPSLGFQTLQGSLRIILLANPLSHI